MDIHRDPYPEPDVIYHRTSKYHDFSPTFPSDFEKGYSYPPQINLCDYWDYLCGIQVEAVRGWRNGLVPPLRRLSVFITDLCNLNCSYCKRDPKAAKTMNSKWLLENLPAARSMGALFFDVMGLGEPTLIDALPDLLQKASSLGFVGTLGTNGATPNTADSNYLAKLFDASPLKIRVSVDSADPKIHNQMRGKQETWHQSVSFIKKVALAREQGRLRAGIFVNRVVTSETLHMIPDDIKFFAQLGVDDVQLIPVRYKREQFCTPEQIVAFNTTIAPQIQELGKKYQMAWVRENAFIYGRTLSERERSSRGMYYSQTTAKDCYALKAQMVLDPQRRPFTCLWGKRAGGRPIETSISLHEHLHHVRERLLDVNYMEINPTICENYCTKEIIAANNHIQVQLEE